MDIGPYGDGDCDGNHRDDDDDTSDLLNYLVSASLFLKIRSLGYVLSPCDITFQVACRLFSRKR